MHEYDRLDKVHFGNISKYTNDQLNDEENTGNIPNFDRFVIL